MQWTIGSLAAIRCGSAYYRDNGSGVYNQFTLVTDADEPCKIEQEMGDNIIVCLKRNDEFVMASKSAVTLLSVQASY